MTKVVKKGAEHEKDRLKSMELLKMRDKMFATYNYQPEGTDDF